MRNRMLRRLTALVMAFVLFTGAAAAESPVVITGSYEFTSNENHNIQRTDTFTWRDDCFMQSSYVGCSHLMELSASAAIASASRYGDAESPWDSDLSDPAKNIRNFLQAAGFRDVETNKYYGLEKLENSAAAALGHREIQDGSKTYTLLAIIPRSAGYKQEWVGNFTVDNGSSSKMHAGFKAGRDEILRFTKQYIASHGITGDLKIWIAGHSRGAALSNMLGGFIAGGGAAYFPNVSIEPDNVYCYTFATPRTIQPGLTHDEDLTVAGARGSAYPDDTPGAAWSSTSRGAFDPRAVIYNGIRNYPQPFDFITKLPPVGWRYTWYGRDFSSDGDGTVTDADMLAQLRGFSTFAADKYENGGNPNLYSNYTLDLQNMTLAPVSAGPANMEEMINNRAAALVYLARFVSDYRKTGAKGSYQEALKSLAGAYGMLWDLDYVTEGFDIGSAILPLVLVVVDYAVERMKEDGTISKDATDAEAISVALEKLLCTLCKTGGDHTVHTAFTVDTVLDHLAKTLTPNKQDTKLLDTVAEKLSGMMIDANPDIQNALKMLLAYFVPPDQAATTPQKDMLKALVKALGYGATADSKVVIDNGKEYMQPENVRKFILFMAAFAVMAMLPAEMKPLASLISKPETPLNKVIEAALPLLLGGAPSLSEAADVQAANLVDPLFAHSLDLVQAHIGNAAFLEQVRAHIQGLKDNINPLRRLLMYMLLYTQGEAFSFEESIRTAATLVGNVGIIPPAHYNEVNLAWARALRVAGYMDHALYTVTEGDGQTWVKGSATGAAFRVVRSIGDEQTFGLSTDILVDGNRLPGGSYTREPGSLKVTLKPTYLQGVPVGRHSILFRFRDGAALASFFVSDTPVTPTPSAGPVTPTPDPSSRPTATPSPGPSGRPTATPTPGPSGRPTATPSAGPSGRPTATPSAGPSGRPTATPSAGPSTRPTATPTPGGDPTPRPVPQTGDSAQPVLWFVLLLAGIGCAVVLLPRRKRK